jgi:hypothetical protein
MPALRKAGAWQFEPFQMICITSVQPFKGAFVEEFDAVKDGTFIFDRVHGFLSFPEYDQMNWCCDQDFLEDFSLPPNTFGDSRCAHSVIRYLSVDHLYPAARPLGHALQRCFKAVARVA